MSKEAGIASYVDSEPLPGPWQGAREPSRAHWRWLPAGAVAVVTNDGRFFVVGRARVAAAQGLRASCGRLTRVRTCAQGTLKGYDQLTNLILYDCQERIFTGNVRAHAVPARTLCVRLLTCGARACRRAPSSSCWACKSCAATTCAPWEPAFPPGTRSACCRSRI